MEKRVLGNGLEVSAVGLGCMGFTHAYGAPSDLKEAKRALEESIEMGYTFFDTAERYFGFDASGKQLWNEELVGDALAGCRNKVRIATKFGIGVTAEGEMLLDSHPQTIRSSVEGSLKRLGTDYIDLYYQHRIDPNIPPEEVAGVMADLIKEGKILHWGISETDENYLRRAHAVCPVTAIQNRYSMMARWHESLFPVLEELHVGYVAFSPLANGFLTAAYQNEVFTDKDDYRRNMPQYTEKGYAENAPVIELVRRYAEEKGATPAQISLAWMLCKKPYLVPIPGSRKADRLRENADAAKIKLSPEEIIEIDSALDQMELSVYGGASYKVQEGAEK